MRVSLKGIYLGHNSREKVSTVNLSQRKDDGSYRGCPPVAVFDADLRHGLASLRVGAEIDMEVDCYLDKATGRLNVICRAYSA